MHDERAVSGAAEAIRPVHVLDRGRRQHVTAGRHRAHDIRDRERRLVLAVAIEEGDVAIVARLRMRRLDVAFEPGKIIGRAAVEEVGIIDLQSSGQMIDKQEPRIRRLALRYFDNRHEPIVLLDVGGIGLAAV